METNNNTFNTELNQEMNDNTSGNSRARLAAIGGAVLASAAGGAGVAYALSDIGIEPVEPEEPAEPETPETPSLVRVVMKEEVKMEEKPNEEPIEPEEENFLTINGLKVVDMGHTEIEGQMVAYAVVEAPEGDYYYMYDIDRDEVFDVIANEQGEYAFFDQTNPLETISYADAFDQIDDHELMARLIAEGETPVLPEFVPYYDDMVTDDVVTEEPAEAVDTLETEDNELLASTDEPEESWPVEEEEPEESWPAEEFENDSLLADNQESWPTDDATTDDLMA